MDEGRPCVGAWGGKGEKSELTHLRQRAANADIIRDSSGALNSQITTPEPDTPHLVLLPEDANQLQRRCLADAVDANVN